MRAIGVILVILALVIGIVPQFTDCLAQGKVITLASGNSLPMRCHWTRQAEIAVALPLLSVGGLMIFSRRRHTLRALSSVALVLGVTAILVPTYLIGVCASDEMICSMLMKPTLVFAGVLITAASLVGLVYLRGERPELIDEEVEAVT